MSVASCRFRSSHRNDTVHSVIEAALERAGVRHTERQSKLAETLGRAGFKDFETAAAEFRAAGASALRLPRRWWRIRTFCCSTSRRTTSISQAFNGWKPCCKTQRSLPWWSRTTGIFSKMSRTIWWNSIALYADGFLRVRGNYSAFLEAKKNISTRRKKRQEALENRVHTEIEWLRRGPKARTTKSKSRIDKAHKMIGELAGMNARSAEATADIDFSATNRQTKQLIRLENVSYSIGSANCSMASISRLRRECE